MEHPGAVLLTSTYLFSELNPTSRSEMMISILHELSHMWFGNLGMYFKYTISYDAMVG